MPFTLVAFSESIAPAGAFVNIAAVPDQHVFVTGDDIRIPDTYNSIIGVAGLVATPVTLPLLRIESPSMRSLFNLDVTGISLGSVFPVDPNLALFPTNPVEVMPAEAIQALFNTTSLAADHVVLVWLSDGPITPVAGPMRTVRATIASTGTANVWTNAAITFTQTLPVGRYHVVGMRMNSGVLAANTHIAARLVFVGGLWRPGVIGTNLLTSQVGDAWPFRNGHMGVWGEFHTNAPPTVDLLSDAAGTATIFLDVIRVG